MKQLRSYVWRSCTALRKDINSNFSWRQSCLSWVWFLQHSDFSSFSCIGLVKTDYWALHLFNRREGRGKWSLRISLSSQVTGMLLVRVFPSQNHSFPDYMLFFSIPIWLHALWSSPGVPKTYMQIFSFNPSPNLFWNGTFLFLNDQ